MGTLAYGNIDAGIAQAEGYNTPGTIPALAFNPGDIVAGPFATAHGATGSITAAGGQQIATFPDANTGFAATDALVAQKFSTGAATDIPSLAQSWLGTGASPTDVSNWASAVSSSANPPASTPVTPSASLTKPSTWGPAIVSSLGITAGRGAAFVVGLLFIAGGIMSLKTTQSIIVTAGRAAGRGAAAAAL